MLVDVAIVLGLILLNGVFAMSELAVVSSRKSRLQNLARRGVHGARTALKLTEDPTAFLSTVQIGITLVGILAGAFSGVALGEEVAGIRLLCAAGNTVGESPGNGRSGGIGLAASRRHDVDRPIRVSGCRHHQGDHQPQAGRYAVAQN